LHLLIIRAFAPAGTWIKNAFSIAVIYRLLGTHACAILYEFFVFLAVTASSAATARAWICIYIPAAV
jgi:hypothetical protein